jgi:DNA-binding MltR family transcriptional regulator
MASNFHKLHKLTNKPATAEHQEEYNKQTAAKADDRGFCLLVSAHVENALEQALDHLMGKLPEGVREAVYRDDGPLATFAQKITMAHALEIIGPVTYANLRNIRQVRNAFAHAKVPINFKTAEVAAVCSDLQCINIFDPPEEVDQEPTLSARDRFETVCHQIMVRLVSYTGHDVQFKKSDGTPAKILKTALP